MSHAAVSHLPELNQAEPAPMPFLDWAALHILERLPDVARCERHGVLLDLVDDKPVCRACKCGVRPVTP